MALHNKHLYWALFIAPNRRRTKRFKLGPSWTICSGAQNSSAFSKGSAGPSELLTRSEQGLALNGEPRMYLAIDHLRSELGLTSVHVLV